MASPIASTASRCTCGACDVAVRVHGDADVGVTEQLGHRLRGHALGEPRYRQRRRSPRAGLPFSERPLREYDRDLRLEHRCVVSAPVDRLQARCGPVRHHRPVQIVREEGGDAPYVAAVPVITPATVRAHHHEVHVVLHGPRGNDLPGVALQHHGLVGHVRGAQRRIPVVLEPTTSLYDRLLVSHSARPVGVGWGRAPSRGVTRCARERLRVGSRGCQDAILAGMTSLVSRGSAGASYSNAMVCSAR